MKTYNLGEVILQSRLIEEVKKHGIERMEDLIKGVYSFMPKTKEILLSQLYSIYKFGGLK